MHRRIPAQLAPMGTARQPIASLHALSAADPASAVPKPPQPQQESLPMISVDIDRAEPLDGLREAAAIVASGRAALWLAGIGELLLDDDYPCRAWLIEPAALRHLEELWRHVVALSAPGGNGDGGGDEGEPGNSDRQQAG